MASFVRFKGKWRAHVYADGRRDSRVFRTLIQAKSWAWRRQFDLKHAAVWCPPSVTILPLSTLRSLPQVCAAEQVSGVYFLWNRDRLVYIGQSKNVPKRVASHRVKPPTFFDWSTYMSVPSPWQLAIEALYIEAYLPQLEAEEPGMVV